MITAVNAAKPPKNLVLGEQALTRYRARLDDIKSELETWEDVTLGADFPEGQ